MTVSYVLLQLLVTWEQFTQKLQSFRVFRKHTAGGLEVCWGQEGFQGERILTRADLPTPPEPNTTSLYSRMAGLLHRTAQQSALDKKGRSKIGQIKWESWKNWGNETNKNQTRSSFPLKLNKGIFPESGLWVFPLQKGRILVIPGGYGQEAAQQWREHP